jgi:hypothetical protein
MLSLTGGELAMVLFIFALTWGAGWLPRVAERLGAQRASRLAGAPLAERVTAGTVERPPPKA